MIPYLFDSLILPTGFKLPLVYVEEAIINKLPELQPWRFLSENMAEAIYYYGALLLKFPGKPLIPFAIIQDETGFYNDGWITLACFDGLDVSGDPVVRIYDYSTPKVSPWGNLNYPSFSAWVDAAKEESARYKLERAED